MKPMKKVRFDGFESPQSYNNFINMSGSECHSPRPYIQRQMPAMAPESNYPRPLAYSSDPVKRFECSDSSPYPLMNKTQLPSEERPKWSPSNDLDLSMLDASFHEPRRPMFCKSILKAIDNNVDSMNTVKDSPQVSSSIENNVNPPNVLSKDNDFFLRRDNLSNFNISLNPLQKQLNKIRFDKENTPIAKKMEMKTAIFGNENKNVQQQSVGPMDGDCGYHHCTGSPSPNPQINQGNQNYYTAPIKPILNHSHRQSHCHCLVPPQPVCVCCENRLPPKQFNPQICNYNKEHLNSPKMNGVDKKTWAIERYEQSKNPECMEVEKQTSIGKEKREPTVADLLKIIKLQNEQLQLLQEKVDKFISTQTQHQHAPTQNCMSEQVAIETVGREQHKISIGVMTSFEMVRTSTIINKEVLKTKENAQIQCNRSQISIKEVVSKSQPPLNFLDGIAHVDKTGRPDIENNVFTNTRPQYEGNEEKTLNEISLYNVQVDNATTPLMSPDQSLYLDVRDYSDSETGSDDQSNVGWTYYNKVMTHVNGMLQDSDMPSSASALYRNTRQQMQTVQMQIDKTNVSVTKRVKFGDDPLGIRQPHIYAATTDTSLKMNQLAAKYLKNGPPIVAPQPPAPKPIAAPIDMSFATRNYMERHKLLQGIPPSSRSPPCEMPRFLDITALKQQPKLL